MNKSIIIIADNFHEYWLDSDRLADKFEWPFIIKNGNDASVLCYEKNYALLAGCFGYVCNI